MFVFIGLFWAIFDNDCHKNDTIIRVSQGSKNSVKKIYLFVNNFFFTINITYVTISP